MKTNRPFLFLATLASLSLAACGSKPEEEDPKGDGSALIPGQSGDFCKAPTPELDSFQPLDKDLFVRTLADYLVGWMRPLHEGLLSLDEARFLEVVQEAVLGTYDTACKPERDLEFLPPEDDLVDPEVQADVREAIEDVFADATVVATDDPTVLRLSIHECSNCDEPIGTEPSFLTARLTESGVLALEYELSAAKPWSKHLYVTTDSVILEGELAPLSDWTDTLSSDTRDGSLRFPNAAGKLTAFVNKTDDGKLTASLGLSGFSFETDAERPLRLVSTSPCVGMYGELDRAKGQALFGVFTGQLDLEIPGSSHCSVESKCSPAEYDGVFTYHAGDLTLTSEHPEKSSASAARFGLNAKDESTATAPSGTFGEFALGHDDAKNDTFTIDLLDTPEGIRVVFDPVFDLRAALVVSNLSDALRVDFPDWLSDEVFDLSFGGDPKPTLLVPHRAACAVDSNDVYRRLVEVEAGTVHGVVGAGRDERAEPGQCLGQTRRPTSELGFTSDWVEVLECE